MPAARTAAGSVATTTASEPELCTRLVVRAVRAEDRRLGVHQQQAPRAYRHERRLAEQIAHPPARPPPATHRLDPLGHVALVLPRLVADAHQLVVAEHHHDPSAAPSHEVVYEREHVPRPRPGRRVLEPLEVPIQELRVPVRPVVATSVVVDRVPAHH